MDFSLTDRQRDVISVAAEVSTTSLTPRAARHDLESDYPSDNIRDIHQAGLLGLNIPERYGGHGAGYGGPYLTYYLVVEELAKGCGSTLLFYLVQQNALSRINVLGSEAQRRRYFGKVLGEGATFGSLGSEPPTLRSGAARGFITQAPRVQGGWVLNGAKQFASGSGGATYFQVFATAEGSTSPLDGLLLLNVRAGSAGFEMIRVWDAMGMRASDSQSLTITDCFVADDDVLGEPGALLRPDVFGQIFQLAFAANYIGVAQFAFTAAVHYVSERTRPPIALSRAIDDPRVQIRFGEMSVGIEAAQHLIYKAAWMQQQGEQSTLDAKVASAVATYRARAQAARVALEVTNGVFELLGARSSFRKEQFDRYWRDVRTYTLHDPIHRKLQTIGQQVIRVSELQLGLS